MLRVEAYSEKTLFWYFGCLLFEMITGTVPFQSASMNNVLQDIMKANVKFPTSVPEDAKSLLILVICFPFVVDLASSLK